MQSWVCVPEMLLRLASVRILQTASRLAFSRTSPKNNFVHSRFRVTTHGVFTFTSRFFRAPNFRALWLAVRLSEGGGGAGRGKPCTHSQWLLSCYLTGGQACVSGERGRCIPITHWVSTCPWASGQVYVSRGRGHPTPSPIGSLPAPLASGQVYVSGGRGRPTPSPIGSLPAL